MISMLILYNLMYDLFNLMLKLHDISHNHITQLCTTVRYVQKQKKGSVSLHFFFCYYQFSHSTKKYAGGDNIK